MELLKLFDSIAKSIIYRSWQKNPAYYQSLSMTKKDLEQEIFIHFQRSYNKYHEKKFGKELENILAQTVINRLDRTRLESVIINKNNEKYEYEYYDVFNLSGNFIKRKISKKIIPKYNKIITERLPQESFKLDEFISKNIEQSKNIDFNINDLEEFLDEQEFLINNKKLLFI